MRVTPEQHEQVWARDRGRCIWTGCRLPATQIAHFHSKGAGGRPSANVPGNMGLMCDDHALMSDGLYGSGGAEEYRNAHLALFGPRFLEMPQHRIAWERAEELTLLVGRLSS